MNFAGRKQEFISMEYAGGTRLYLPVSRINLIQKYVGSAKPPRLSTLGTKTWLKTKQKITGRLRDLASELLEIYAYRKKKKGFAFSADTDWQREFEHAFIYEETLDQKKSRKRVEERYGKSYADGPASLRGCWLREDRGSDESFF